MARLKALAPAVVNGLATYAGVVSVLFFIDVLLASIDLPILTSRIVIDPAGEGNALSARDVIAILSGLAVGVITLARKLRAQKHQGS